MEITTQPRSRRRQLLAARSTLLACVLVAGREDFQGPTDVGSAPDALPRAVAV